MRTKNPHSLRSHAAKERVSHMTISRSATFSNAVMIICENINVSFMEFLTLIQNAYPKIPSSDLILISKISPDKQKECFDSILPDCINAKQIIKYYIGTTNHSKPLHITRISP